jgi:hypothetical protein
MVTIWNYWWAAGRKVGLTKEDIGRQLEAECVETILGSVGHVLICLDMAWTLLRGCRS